LAIVALSIGRPLAKAGERSSYERPAATNGLNFEALRRAIEQSDFDSLMNFYAENAELYSVNRNTPPSSPEVLRGKEAIAERLEDVCGREQKRVASLEKRTR
jgi:hypothetical protein